MTCRDTATTLSGASLTPRTQKVITIGNITEVAVNGQDLGLGGYLDIGLIDTMKDLFVNFIGAVVFSILGYFYLTRRSKRTAFIERFIPTVTAKEE